jgi:hypothetical protein
MWFAWARKIANRNSQRKISLQHLRQLLTICSACGKESVIFNAGLIGVLQIERRFR